jgi:hypothetical protein
MITRIEVVRETMQFYGIDEAAARKMLHDEQSRTVTAVNHLYQVAVGWCGEGGEVLHINIRRRDGGAIFDFRHMQQIKNETAGDEACGWQMFPPESKLVDTSNKYHLFVPPPDKLHLLATVGWNKRDVQYNENRDVPGLRQRAF